MRNLIKKILQETTEDEVASFEKMRSLANKVAKFLSRLEVDDSVCKYMITPFVVGYGTINVMVLTTNPYQKESVINDIRIKVKTTFKGYKIDLYSFPNYDNRSCEEFEEAFDNYLQNYPDSNAIFVNPKHKKTNLDEKWSEKYKRSIDCSRPKGFSQRAHCQGRKKRDLDEYSRTLKMARRQGSGTRFPKSAIKSNPMRFREYSRLNENDKTDQIIKKGIRKVIDKEITSWGYNKDKTTVFLFDKNDKCLIDYDVKNKKLWYDHHLLDIVGRKIKTEGFLGQQFREVLRDWFEDSFKKYEYKVDPNKKVEGANIRLY